MNIYKGCWSFAPLPDPIIYYVVAKTENEADKKLLTWALENRHIVDDPYDFYTEQIA